MHTIKFLNRTRSKFTSLLLISALIIGMSSCERVFNNALAKDLAGEYSTLELEWDYDVSTGFDYDFLQDSFTLVTVDEADGIVYLYGAEIPLEEQEDGSLAFEGDLWTVQFFPELDSFMYRKCRTFLCNGGFEARGKKGAVTP